MQIESPIPTKILDYYDITFESGTGMSLTIDRKAGDTISFDDAAILVSLSSKPSPASEERLPAEDITIFPKHIVAIQHRTKEVPILTAQQQQEWSKTLQEMGKTIH